MTKNTTPKQDIPFEADDLLRAVEATLFAAEEPMFRRCNIHPFGRRERSRGAKDLARAL